MAGLGTLMKLARGGMGPDELQTMFAAVGIDMEMGLVEQPRGEFRELMATASLPGTKLVRLKGSTKGGEKIRALLLVTEPGASKQ